MNRPPVILLTGASGGLDALVNNAGVIDPLARTADISVKDWEKTPPSFHRAQK